MVVTSILLVFAFAALTSSRHFVTNRNRLHSSGSSKIMHSQTAPLILQEFRQLSQFENSPMRRDSFPIYLINSKSKNYKKRLNTKNMISPEITQVLVIPDHKKKHVQPHKVVEVEYMKDEDNSPLDLSMLFDSNRETVDKTEGLSPLFDAHEIDQLGQIVGLIRDETTDRTVFKFRDLVV